MTKQSLNALDIRRESQKGLLHPRSSSSDWGVVSPGVNLQLTCQNPSCRLSKIGSTHWRPVGFGVYEIIGAKPDMDAIRAQVEEAVDDPQQKRRATLNVVEAKVQARAVKQKLRLLKEKRALQKAEAEVKRKKLNFS